MTAPDNRAWRGVLVLAVGLLSVALLWLFLSTAHSALRLWRELASQPTWLLWLLGAAVLGITAAGAWGVWRLLHPRPRPRPPAAAPDRASIERRVERLQERHAETAAFEAELRELDQRAASGECYVAVFGEISAGKSSVIRALAAQAAVDVDVLGGTTSRVAHYRGLLDQRALILADVPGTQEIAARERETLARDEALRAHVVIYVTASELTRQQMTELRWLRNFGKPVLVALNKIDQLSEQERTQVVAALGQHTDAMDALVTVQAGGSERFERRLADGRREQVVREAVPDITALRDALRHCLSIDAAALEQARAAAVLSGLGEHLGTAEQHMLQRESALIVERFTRRAMVGAMAAVAPGTDLLIQGALATALIRELSALHEVRLRELDLDGFLQQASLTVRTTSSVVLAIAGNALKAFPGLGTLGGGILHAVAYGLIFDSLGRAVSQTLLAHHSLDQQHAQSGLQQLLADDARGRMARMAQLALNTLTAKDRDRPA